MIRIVTTPKPPESPSAPRGSVTLHASTLVAGVVVLLALVGAAVGLALAHWQTGAIIGLLTAIIGVASVALTLVDQLGKARVEQTHQTATLGAIQEQTNGALSARIEEAVAAALAKQRDEAPPIPGEQAAA